MRFLGNKTYTKSICHLDSIFISPWYRTFIAVKVAQMIMKSLSSFYWARISSHELTSSFKHWNGNALDSNSGNVRFDYGLRHRLSSLKIPMLFSVCCGLTSRCLVTDPSNVLCFRAHLPTGCHLSRCCRLSTRLDSTRLGPTANKVKVQVQVMLDRRSFGQSALVSRNHLGSKTRFLLLSDSCRFVDVGCPLCQEEGSVVCNCCWSSPAKSFLGPSPTGLRTVFYSLGFKIPPTWRARDPYLYPPITEWPIYTPRHWVPFSSSPTPRRTMTEVFESSSTRSWVLCQSQSRRCEILETAKIWSWVSKGHDTKNDCAVGGQQQFTGLVWTGLSGRHELVVRWSKASNDMSRRGYCLDPLPGNDQRRHNRHRRLHICCSTVICRVCISVKLSWLFYLQVISIQ
jgi:hypothetical protein